MLIVTFSVGKVASNKLIATFSVGTWDSNEWRSNGHFLH
jgi:hypothetical protein